MQSKAFEYIEKNRWRFISELQEYLRFPSVGTQPIHYQDMISCAQWLVSHFISIGLEAKVIETSEKPIVWARLKGDASRRVIIYGHYDVQPEDPLDQWESPPFEPVIRNDMIYARGAVDNKGPLFAHIKGIETLLKTDQKPENEIIFLVEGDEECGGDTFSRYITTNKSDLGSYAVIISDTTLYKDMPAICYGLRGMVSLEIVIKSPNRDLHSGSFGGAIPNPATILANIISRCIDENGNVLIDGFYDGINQSSDWEKKNLASLKFDAAKFRQNTGIRKVWGSSNVDALEKMWSRPTFEVNGIYGGYMGQGGKTIIPSYAGAKITMRIVPPQQASEISRLAQNHIRNVCPDSVELQIHAEQVGADPVCFDLDHPAIRVASEAFKQGFGKETVFVREGCSIPMVATICSQLKCPVLLMGFGSESNNFHSPNENFSLKNFENGIKTSAVLLNSI